MECTAQADPDIAGLGVRISVYIQAILCMVPSTVLVLFGPDIDETFPKVSKRMYSQGRTTVAMMIVTNGALLIPAFVKVTDKTLTIYHAAIVLNLSWIVFLGALSSAITLSLVHPLRKEPLLTLLLRIVLSPLQEWDKVSLSQTITLLIRQFNAPDHIMRRVFMVLRSELHLLCLSLHLFLIGILGVILFSKGGTLAANVDCDPDVVLWTFGTFFRLTGPKFQNFWFGIYVATLVPVANIGLSAFIIVLVFALPWWLLLSVGRWVSPSLGQSNVLNRLGFVLPFLAMIPLLIVCTQKTVSANRADNTVSIGENAWGFGQILAIVVLIVPAIETYGRLRIIILSPRPVLLPPLPAQAASRAADYATHRHAARALALERRREWRTHVQHAIPIGRKPPVEFTLGKNGNLGIPVVKDDAVIDNATVDEILGTIVPHGMREAWDTRLDYDGVLKRYDQETALRYAANKGEISSSGAEGKPSDFVLVQLVKHGDDPEQEITVTYASATNNITDTLPERPDYERGTLHFEGWLIRQEGANVRLACVSHLVLKDTMPLATARDLLRQCRSHPKQVRWAYRHYGFAPVWSVTNNAGILEYERMDTVTGTYTATFHTKNNGVITMKYDTAERIMYKPYSKVRWMLIKGSHQHITATRTPGKLTFKVSLEGALVEVNIHRTLKVSLPEPPELEEEELLPVALPRVSRRRSFDV